MTLKAKKLLIGTAFITDTLIIAALLWAILPYGVMENARIALDSDNIVQVSVGEDIIFYPADNFSDRGFIFYPGTRVDSEAYAALAKLIARQGHLVVLAQMPLDLSVLDNDRAGEIISHCNETFGKVEKWAIGGHSMGGAMAAFYARDHPGEIDGLIFLGSYPSKNTDLSDISLAQLSLYGSNDHVATEKEIMEKAPLAPEDSRFLRIEGGNHSGFGYYGEQKGDGPAEISREEQHRIASKEIGSFLENL